MPPETPQPDSPPAEMTTPEGLTIDTPQESAPAPQAAPDPGDFFTAEDVANVRKQEKDKLYPRIEELSTELRTLRAEREHTLREKEEQEARLAEEARLKAEEAMEVRELLQKKDEEWQSRFASVQEELEQRDAMLERERELQELTEYRNQRIAAETNSLMPELLDFVTGNSREEIDASLNAVKERTSRILSQVQNSQASHRQQMTGTRPTAPPMGPVEENDSMQRTYTADDIRQMNPSEYAQVRAQLRKAASDRVQSSGPYSR